MKRNTSLAIYGIGVLVVAFLVMSNLGVAQADELGAWKSRTFVAKVVSVDKDAYTITLVDRKKNEGVFAVDTNIKDLDKFAAGDKVTAKAYMALATDVRKPTAEEAKAPFAELDTKYDPPANTAPKAGKLNMYKDVVKVLGVDRMLKAIQVKTSKGKILTVDASNSKFFGSTDAKAGDNPTPKIGDSIIVTYTQPIVVSLKKK